ncbi:MAG: OprO/OprP family phosphate-selective porin [Gemmatimonadota bacterium]|nr:OprO/OprP family phosphate-selective porin [Gemmatimonadota bacterium]
MSWTSLSRLGARSFIVLASALFGLVSGASLEAQQRPEPIVDALRQRFSSEGMTLGFLLRAVVDPGVDGDPARVRVDQARLRLYGRLDGGFSYRIQTNHASTSTLLDAQVSWSPGPEFVVSAGRFKTPFSQELLDYVGVLDFVDRSRVVNALAPNRQVGVQVETRLNEHVDLVAGGFTGATSATADESLIGVVRLQGSGFELGSGMLDVSAHLAGGREDAIGARALGPTFSGDGLIYGFDARFQSGDVTLKGEYIRGDWDPDFGVLDVDADGLFITFGYMLAENRQALIRWDRYTAPGADADDVLLLGFNVWPTGPAKVQVNWRIPLKDSTELHKLLINFQLGVS